MFSSAMKSRPETSAMTSLRGIYTLNPRGIATLWRCDGGGASMYDASIYERMTLVFLPENLEIRSLRNERIRSA